MMAEVFCVSVEVFTYGAMLLVGALRLVQKHFSTFASRDYIQVLQTLRGYNGY